MEQDDLNQLADEERQLDEEIKAMEEIEMNPEEKEKIELINISMNQVSKVPNKLVEVASNVISAAGKPALRLLPAIISTETAKIYVSELATKTFGNIVGSATPVNAIVYAGTFAIETGIHLFHYFKGEMTGEDLKRSLIISLAQNGAGFVLSTGGMAIGALIGSTICPGLGTLIGSFIGSLLAGLANSLILSKKIEKYINKKCNYSSPEDMYKRALESWGVTEKTTQKEIERKCRQFQLMFHPDKSPPDDKEANHKKYMETMLTMQTIKQYRKSQNRWEGE